jgi:hypothetical protein
MVMVRGRKGKEGRGREGRKRKTRHMSCESYVKESRGGRELLRCESGGEGTANTLREY